LSDALTGDSLPIKKRIVPFDQGDPDTEPLFINYAHCLFAGGSAYLDVGVIPVESYQLHDTQGEVDFAVLTRLVMSESTLVMIRDQITDLLAQRDKINVVQG